MIPDNWIEIKLRDALALLESGKRPKGGVKGITSGIPSIGGEHLAPDGGFDFSNIRFVPVSFAKAMTKGWISKNDILVVKDGATTGKVSFVGKDFPHQEAVINEHVFRCVTSPGVDSKFVFYYLWSAPGQKKILLDFRGAAQGGISSGFVNKVDLFLPPLPEQKRIVAKIEELFSDLDKAVESLKKAQAQLKTYRQAVLKYAFEGRFTHKYIKPGELPEGWRWVRLGDLSNGVEYGSSKKSKPKGSVAVLRMGNIQDGKFDWTDLVFSSDKAEIKKYALKPGDVLFNRTNSPELVGKTAIYMGDQPAIFAGYLIRVNHKTELLTSKYLNYFLNGPVAKQYAKDAKTDGVNQSNINGKKLSSYLIPTCSLEQQEIVVSNIETRLSEADNLEKAIAASLEKAEATRQSILKKAFEGRLVRTALNQGDFE